MASRPGVSRRFPIGVFLGAVVFICLALAVSALLSYARMAEMRNLYLEEKSQDIARLLTESLRGPDRLEMEAWRKVMDETRSAGTYPWLKSLALLDETGQVRVKSGEESPELYLNETAVRAPRWGRGQGGGVGHQGPGEGLGLGPGPGQGQGRRPGALAEQAPSLRLRVGIDRSIARFITSQAYVHVIVSALGIVALSVLAAFFVRTLRSFLELQGKEEAQRHLAALGRLSAILAHEIRNPLGAIKGLTQVAQERLPKDHDTQELMKTVVAEAERLERLVTDLLAFARPRPMTLTRVDLKQLVAEVAEGLRSQASEKGTAIQLSDSASPAAAQADPDGVRQVVFNVLVNAIEASPAQSVITVKIECGQQECLLEISDEGAGMGEQNPDELFQPFVTTKTRGTGLGLPVSRQIIERLGGKIELRNREPRGAVCRLTLPASGASARTGPLAAQASEG